MPLGDLPLQYPFPYKNNSGDTGASRLYDLVVSSTENPTGFNNGTGALQVLGGAQIYGDLWVGGNLYTQGQVYSSEFTSNLIGDGTGEITTTHSSGQVAISADQKVVVLSFYITATYTDAALTDIRIANIPYVGADMAQYSTDIICSVDQTIGMIDASSNDIRLLGPDLLPLGFTGNGTFSIVVSFVFLTSASVATFLPSWTSESGSVGTVTYNTRLGKWAAFNNAVVESIRLDISTTGGSSPVGIQVGNNPHTFNTHNIASTAFMSGALAAQPFMLKTTPGTNSQAVYNASTLSPQNSSDSGALDLGITAWYFNGAPASYTPVLAGTGGTIAYNIQRGFIAYYDTGVMYYIRLTGTVTGTAANLTLTLPSDNGVTPHATRKIYSTLGQPIVFTVPGALDTGYFVNDNTSNFYSLTNTDFDIEISGAYNAASTFTPPTFSTTPWAATFTGTGTMTNTITSTSVNSSSQESSIVACSVSCVYTGSPSNLAVAGLPFNSASVIQYIGDITCSQGPVFGILHPGTTSILLYNQSTLLPLSLTGSGTFTLKLCTTLLTYKAYKAFTPVLGAATYTWRDAIYASFQGANHAVLTIKGSNGTMALTGVTSTQPYVGMSNTFVTGVDQPLLIENGSFINSSTFASISSTSNYSLGGGFTYFTSSSPFTPVLGVESGSVGAVVYSTQTGAYTTYAQGVVYTIVLIGTYTGASTGQINISLPFTCDRDCISRQVKSTWGSPVYFTTVAGFSKGWLVNDSTETAYTINGSGSFELRITGVFTK